MVFGGRPEVDSTLWSEAAFDVQIDGIEQLDQVVGDSIYASLMELTRLTKPSQIELEQLAFDAAKVRHAIDGGKVRLACQRARKISARPGGADDVDGPSPA
jgi:hypothetical protein